MRLAERGTCSMPYAAALADYDGIASADTDTHPRGIGASLGVSSHILPYAFGRYGLPVPPVKPEDAVGLGYRVPALDVGQCLPLLLARLHVALAQLPREQLDLFFPERHQRVLTAMVVAPLPS